MTPRQNQHDRSPLSHLDFCFSPGMKIRVFQDSGGAWRQPKVSARGRKPTPRVALALCPIVKDWYFLFSVSHFVLALRITAVLVSRAITMEAYEKLVSRRSHTCRPNSYTDLSTHVKIEVPLSRKGEKERRSKSRGSGIGEQDQN